tara:strand:- start:623 stop:1369 length:747 start_codon:yes stop_codon:yes gene_type:complete
MKKKVLDSFISIGSFNKLLNNIFLLSDENTSSYVCVCNVHMIVEAQNNNDFNKLLNNSDIVLPDGMPVGKFMSWKHSIQQERVSGMDMMPELIEECAKRKKSIFFYGTTNEVLGNIRKKINSDFPLLEIDIYSPPFRNLSTSQEEEIIQKINDFNPDFVFVALGCPKQEKWMAKHKGKINSCMIGLGGAFSVYAGLQKRAPKWMCDNSLEWMYRLILEPRRLFGRYFVTNTLFILYICIDYLQSKFNK